MVEVSYLAAFFGGVLSLLSPCSALLLPAFFAYVFQSPKALLGKAALFYTGLCVTLVPLGMGISTVSRSRLVPDYLLLAVPAVTVAALTLVRVGAYLRKRDWVSERGSRDGEETSR